MPPDGTHAIILADGAIAGRPVMDAAWPGWDDDVSLVIAADGGAGHALALGLTIDRWVGDGDSIDGGDLAALAATGVRIDRVPVEKDAADAELALEAAIEAGAGSLVLLGGLGGARLDHGVANLGLLLHPALGSRGLVLYDEHAARITLLAASDGPATVELRGRAGDLVSLIPLGATAENVSTEGLQYPLQEEPLLVGRTRGVSNVRTAPTARVTLGGGRILVIETPVTVDR